MKVFITPFRQAQALEYLIGDQKFESTYTYSLMGIPIKIIDVMGNERRYYYNSIGRIERIEQGAY